MRKVILILGALLAFVAVAQEEDPIVIQLGDQSETLSEFDARFEVALQGLAAQQGAELNDALREQLNAYKPQFLDQRATELALLAEAETRGLSVSDDEVEAQVEDIRANGPEDMSFEEFIASVGFGSEDQLRAYLGEKLLAQQVVDQLREEVVVSDEDIAAAYEARAESFQQPEQVCARHILLETEEDAEAVLSDLEAGADFAELAQERSTGPSGPQGGDLGCFDQAQMVAPFGEAAFGADLDTPVGPVETQFGYHVILVYDRQGGGQRSLDEIAPQLEAELGQEQFIAKLDALRENSGIETFPAALGDELPADEE